MTSLPRVFPCCSAFLASSMLNALDTNGLKSHPQLIPQFLQVFLREPMTASNLITDPAVSRFNEQAKALRPDQHTLLKDIQSYHQFC